jgi:hypothetical protein
VGSFVECHYSWEVRSLDRKARLLHALIDAAIATVADSDSLSADTLAALVGFALVSHPCAPVAEARSPRAPAS